MATSSTDDRAWVVAEYARGRLLREIGDDLGVQASSVCAHILGFTEKWSGCTTLEGVYGEARRRVAVVALSNYFLATGTTVERPSRRQEEQYSWARHEHAFLLRCERLTLRQVGARLGVCAERARTMEAKFIRRLRRATRHTHLRVVHD